MEVFNIWISCWLQFFTAFKFPSSAAQGSSDAAWQVPTTQLLLSPVAEAVVVFNIVFFLFTSLLRLSDRACKHSNKPGIADKARSCVSWCADNWDQFIWDHSFETTSFETTSFETPLIWDLFIWDLFIWGLIHMRPHSFENTFTWGHVHFRSHSFYATLKLSCFDLLWITFLWSAFHFLAGNLKFFRVTLHLRFCNVTSFRVEQESKT